MNATGNGDGRAAKKKKIQGLFDFFKLAAFEGVFS